MVDWVCGSLILRLRLTTLLRRLWLQYESLLRRLGLQMTSLTQDGNGHTEILWLHFFYSGRKRRCVVHLFLQSMLETGYRPMPNPNFWLIIYYCFFSHCLFTRAILRIKNKRVRALDCDQNGRICYHFLRMCELKFDVVALVRVHGLRCSKASASYSVRCRAAAHL